jgi:hypothetical protein
MTEAGKVRIPLIIAELFILQPNEEQTLFFPDGRN